MSVDDLIQRGDVLALPPYDGDGDPAGQWDHHIFVRLDAIAALPAAQPAPEVAALVEALDDATRMLKQCTFQTMYVRGQYIDREDVLSKARAALAATENR